MKHEPSQKKNVKVLITAGPTREPIDEVRFISNFATGSLGVELAKEAYDRGYNVELLFGFGTAQIPEHINTARFTTTQSLLEAVLERIGNVDIYISAAAVSDYSPIPTKGKISSDKDQLTIELRPTPKVLKEAKKLSSPDSTFVAFKLASGLPEQALIEQAIESYGNIADLVVANDLTKIEGYKQEAMILYKGQILNRTHTKQELAKALFDCLQNIRDE